MSGWMDRWMSNLGPQGPPSSVTWSQTRSGSPGPRQGLSPAAPLAASSGSHRSHESPRQPVPNPGGPLPDACLCLGHTGLGDAPCPGCSLPLGSAGTVPRTAQPVRFKTVCLSGECGTSSSTMDGLTSSYSPEHDFCLFFSHLTGNLASKEGQTFLTCRRACLSQHGF